LALAATILATPVDMSLELRSIKSGNPQMASQQIFSVSAEVL
jgi:hypothetical protein